MINSYISDEVKNSKACKELYDKLQTLISDEHISQKNKEIKMHQIIGEMYENLMMYEMAAKEYLKEYYLLQNFNDTLDDNEQNKRYYISDCCYRLGKTYRYFGKYSLGLKYLNKGLEQFEDYYTYLDYMELKNIEIEDDKLDLCIDTLICHTGILSQLVDLHWRFAPEDKIEIRLYLEKIMADIKYYNMLSWIVRKKKILLLRLSEYSVELAKSYYLYGMVFKEIQFVEKASYQALSVVKNLMLIKSDVNIPFEKYNKSFIKASKVIGDAKIKCSNSLTEAYDWYSIAINNFLGFKYRIGWGEILLAEILIDFERLFHENKYNGQLNDLLNRYPNVAEFKLLQNRGD